MLSEIFLFRLLPLIIRAQLSICSGLVAKFIGSTTLNFSVSLAQCCKEKRITTIVAAFLRRIETRLRLLYENIQSQGPKMRRHRVRLFHNTSGAVTFTKWL